MEKIIVEKESSQVKMPPSFSCFHQCAWVLLILFGLTGTLQAACPNVVNGVSYPNLPKLTNSGDVSGDWTLTSDSVIYNWNFCVQQQFCQPRRTVLAGDRHCARHQLGELPLLPRQVFLRLRHGSQLQHLCGLQPLNPNRRREGRRGGALRLQHHHDISLLVP